MLKEKDIKNYFEQKQLTYADERTIVGIIMPKKMTYVLSGALASFATQYFIINFNRDAITVVAIDNSTGNLVDDSHLVIANSDVVSKALTSKMLAHELLIITNQGNLVYKLNKTMIGTAWHKKNLRNLILDFND